MITTPFIIGGSMVAFFFAMIWWITYKDIVFEIMFTNWTAETKREKWIVTIGTWLIHLLALNWVIIVIRLLFMQSPLN